ncbi:MAG: dienelactone hydrolase [Planctomycetes bacterium]|nr:dienelactone hydrolase [Planctomycetota bacterium]
MKGRPYARRVTFIVDPKGVIRHVARKVNVRTHGADLTQIIQGLKKTGGDKAPDDTGDTGVLDEAAFKALHELKLDASKRKLRGEMVGVGAGKAYLSLPKGEGPHAGVLVIHEWWGLNLHIKHWADRLAADGYAALAVDLYGGTVATTPDEALKLMRGVDEAAGEDVVKRGLAFLKDDARVRAPRRATIGWSFGGGWSLRAALEHPELDAAVIYYGRLRTDPEELKPVRATIFGIFGNQDRGIPPRVVTQFEKALRRAQVPNAIHRYDANHAFANPSSARYDEKAAAAAWTRVRAFLKKKLRR